MFCWSKRCGVKCNFGICKGINLKIILLQIFFPSAAKLVGITFFWIFKAKTIKKETTGRPDKTLFEGKIIALCIS